MTIRIKHTLPILMLMIGLLATGCEDTDIGLATQAGLDAVRAVTLDDEDGKGVKKGGKSTFDS